MKEDLLEFIRITVKDHFDATRAATDGASLAEQIRSRFPSKTMADAGYEKLSDAVREAEALGYVVRNRQVNHLEILPFGVSSLTPRATTETGRSIYIRPDAWHAFAMQVKSNEANYDPVTVQLIVGDNLPSGREDIVSVKTPSNEDFREWIEIFASEIGVEIPADIAQSDLILREFSKWIVTTGTTNSSRWKKFRAQKVADAIRDWRKQAGVNTEPFLTPVLPNFKTHPVTRMRLEANCDETRDAVIQCIHEMSDTELDALPIPYRLVRLHFRPV